VVAETCRIKTEGIIPRISKALAGGRITKDEAKSLYQRLEDRVAEMVGTLGIKTKSVETDWDGLSDVPPTSTAIGGQESQNGTVAFVVLDAFAKKIQITGRVVGSSPLPKGTGPEWLKTTTKAYDLYVAVDWEANGLIPGKNLRPGMGGKVTLILDEIKDALTIPVLSVYNKKDRYYCMKVQEGTPTETEITVGKMNESRVQVLSGLREGDKVLLVAKAEDGMTSGTPEDDDASGNSLAGEGM